MYDDILTVKDLSVEMRSCGERHHETSSHNSAEQPTSYSGNRREKVCRAYVLHFSKALLTLVIEWVIARPQKACDRLRR